MEIVMAFLIGLIGGSIGTYYFVRQTQERRIIVEYEQRIQILKEQYQEDLRTARNRSIDGSRSVIKGKVAEQLAPFLPNFKYSRIK